MQLIHQTNGKSDCIALKTIERIRGDSSANLSIPVLSLTPGSQSICIKLDPHQVVPESDENNNQVKIRLEVPSYTMLDDFEYSDSPLTHRWQIHEGEGRIETVFDDIFR